MSWFNEGTSKELIMVWPLIIGSWIAFFTCCFQRPKGLGGVVRIFAVLLVVMLLTGQMAANARESILDLDEPLIMRSL